MKIIQSILVILIQLVCLLVTVSFITLMERQLLGAYQIRKGPRICGYFGLFQPLSDGLKLAVKEIIFPEKSNKGMFLLGPMSMLFLIMLIWMFYPGSEFSYWWMNILMVMTLTSYNLFPLYLSGWASNSRYSFLGMMRSGAQTVSYEMIFFTLVLFPWVLFGSSMVFELSIKPSIMGLFLLFFLLWIYVALMETNRLPFDFAEGESELVSGFNIDFGGGLFAIISVSEYASIAWMSVFVSCMLGLVWSSLIIMLIMLSARGFLPRIRYDLVMIYSWKSFLPLAISVLVLVCLFLISSNNSTFKF